MIPKAPALSIGLATAVLAFAGSRPVRGLQAPADRQALQSFRTELRSDSLRSAGRDLRYANRIVSDSDGVELARSAFAALAAGRVVQDRAQVGLALGRFEKLVEARPLWPEAWLGLGQTRAQLAQWHALAKEGALQPLGVGYADGAQAALVRALELDPGFTEAALDLVAGAASTVQARRPATIRAIRTAAWTEIRQPELLLGKARWEATVGDRDSAVAALNQYLTVGGDTAVGYFHLAREMFRGNQGTKAVGIYLEGAERARSDTAWSLFGGDIAWIASPAEWREWAALDENDRTAWLRRFWTRRDVEAGRNPGDRLVEHYRRVEYALTHYGRNGDGRAPPLAWSQREDGDGGAGTENAPLHQEEGAEALSEAPGWERVVGGEAPFRGIRTAPQGVDDRGVIYVRHGPPDQVAFFVGGAGTPANVSWKYAHADGDVIFHFMEADFSGRVGPTVLVPVLPKYMFESRCGLDSELCLLSMNRKVAPERLVKERDRGRAAIAIGVETDGFARSFRDDLAVQAQVYGLFGEVPSDSRQRVVVAWAISEDELQGAHPTSALEGVVYQLKIHLMAMNLKTGVRYDLETNRAIRAGQALKAGDFLTGVSELPVPSGKYLVSASFARHERGSVLRKPEVDVPERYALLSMGDIVIGRSDGSAVISMGGQAVPTNPLGMFRRRDTLEVAYGLSGIQPGAQYDVRLSLLRSDQPGKSVLSLKFVEAGESQDASFRRRIGITGVKRGRYVLRVEVQCRDCTGSARRDAPVAIVD